MTVTWSLSTTQETVVNAHELQSLLGAVQGTESERLHARGSSEWPDRCPDRQTACTRVSGREKVL